MLTCPAGDAATCQIRQHPTRRGETITRINTLFLVSSTGQIPAAGVFSATQSYPYTTRSFASSLRLIIVSAGLGGLVAVLRLAMLHHEAVVSREHTRLSPRGGGLTTCPGASHILASWVLEAGVARIATQTEGIIMEDLSSVVAGL